MMIVTTAMTPSARSSVPTEIPILTPLEHDIVNGSSDNARAPTRLLSYILILCIG